MLYIYYIALWSLCTLVETQRQSLVYTSGFRMCLLHCIAIFYNLTWFCSIKVSKIKLQCNVEKTCRNRVCKCTLSKEMESALFYLALWSDKTRRSNWLYVHSQSNLKSIFWAHFMNVVGMCQFHQCFTHSYYSRRSQKCKKYSQPVSMFCAFGICASKAARKMLMKYTPEPFTRQLGTNLHNSIG